MSGIMGMVGDGDPNWMYETDPLKRSMGGIGHAFSGLRKASEFTGRQIILDGSGNMRLANAAEQKRLDMQAQDNASGP